MLLANRAAVVPLLAHKGRGEGEGIVGGSERERKGRSVKVREATLKGGAMTGKWRRLRGRRNEEDHREN